MSAVVCQSWPVGDEVWGPVPDKAKEALVYMWEKSAFRAALEAKEHTGAQRALGYPVKAATCSGDQPVGTSAE